MIKKYKVEKGLFLSTGKMVCCRFQGRSKKRGGFEI